VLIEDIKKLHSFTNDEASNWFTQWSMWNWPKCSLASSVRMLRILERSMRQSTASRLTWILRELDVLTLLARPKSDWTPQFDQPISKRYKAECDYTKRIHLTNFQSYWTEITSIVKKMEIAFYRSEYPSETWMIGLSVSHEYVQSHGKSLTAGRVWPWSFQVSDASIREILEINMKIK
jgi:hypothetical protein